MTEQAQQSAGRFVQRLSAIQDEVDEIRSDLAARDLIQIAYRCRRMLRELRVLLDTNLTVLFGAEAPEAREDLHGWLNYAEAQIATALSHDYDFEAITRRLSMATMLGNHVLQVMTEATEDLRRRQMI